MLAVDQYIKLCPYIQFGVSKDARMTRYEQPVRPVSYPDRPDIRASDNEERFRHWLRVLCSLIRDEVAEPLP